MSDLVAHPALDLARRGETRALAMLCRDAAASLLATDVIELPESAAGLTVVAFSPDVLDDGGKLHDLALSLSQVGNFGAKLSPRVRVVYPDAGQVRLAEHEQVAISCLADAQILADLLARFGPGRVAYLDVDWRGDGAALADVVAQHPSILGVRATCTQEQATDPLDALASLEHLRALSAYCWNKPSGATPPSTITRLSRLRALRVLGRLSVKRGYDLEPLGALPQLHVLTVNSEHCDGWRPQLPSLRRLGLTLWPEHDAEGNLVYRNDGLSWRLPDLAGCHSLEAVKVYMGGPLTDALDSVAELPALRYLGFLGPASVPPDAVGRLARLVRLRQFWLWERCRMDVPDGQLRYLDTLGALELLSASVTGATDDDVAYLRERLPDATLELNDRNRSNAPRHWFGHWLMQYP